MNNSSKEKIAQLKKCLIEADFKIKDNITGILKLIDTLEKTDDPCNLTEFKIEEIKKIFEALLLKEKKLTNKLKDEISALAKNLPDDAESKEQEDSLLFGEREVLEYFAKNQNIPEDIEELILKLEETEDHNSIVDELFRTFHTLKSEAGFLQINNIHVLSHSLENYLSLLKEDGIKLTSGEVDRLFECHDKISQVFKRGKQNLASAREISVETLIATINSSVESLKNKKKEEAIPNYDVLDKRQIEDIDIYHDFVTESLEHLENIESKILKLEQDPHNEEILNEIFRPLHTIKGISAYLNLEIINKLAHQSESYLDKLRKGEFKVKSTCIDLILKIKDVLMNLIHLVKAQLNDAPISQELVPNLNEIYGNLDRCAKNQNLSEEENSEKPVLETPAEGNLVSEKNVNEHEAKAIVIDDTVKISAKKLDNLLNLVGELVISHNQISQNQNLKKLVDPTLQKTITHSSNIIRDVQQISMGLRMVPIKQTFHKMKRLVRDLSQKSDKQVELHISGAETELDRSTIEYLNDPLIHLIRNAMDHGIESAEERVQLGKTEAARINLKAYHSSGNIVIEINDNGRGIDEQKILESGIKKGLVRKDENLSESEVLKLIFEPGFSTAQKVTEISGRGVGMDVVKKNVDKLSGNIQISTEKGEGSTFILKFPLTMAIMDGMVIEISGEQYILPVLSIKESVRPNHNDINGFMDRGEMIKIRENLFPLVRLQQVLEIEGTEKNVEESIIMVVDNGGKSFGLQVDKILGQQQIVIKNINPYFGSMRGISGYTILGNGMVGLILDTKDLLELHKEQMKLKNTIATQTGSQTLSGALN